MLASWFQCASQHFFREEKPGLVAPSSWKMVLNITSKKGLGLWIHSTNIWHLPVPGTVVNSFSELPAFISYPGGAGGGGCTFHLHSLLYFSGIHLSLHPYCHHYFFFPITDRFFFQVHIKASSALLQNTGLITHIPYLIVHLVPINTVTRLKGFSPVRIKAQSNVNKSLQQRK